jgi:hypothetical protein
LAVGLTGAIAGGLLGAILGVGAFAIVFELAISAGLVYLTTGDRTGGRYRRLSSGRRR